MSKFSILHLFIDLQFFVWSEIYYSLLPEIIIGEVDVSRWILVLDSSIFIHFSDKYFWTKGVHGNLFSRSSHVCSWLLSCLLYSSFQNYCLISGSLCVDAATTEYCSEVLLVNFWHQLLLTVWTNTTLFPLSVTWLLCFTIVCHAYCLVTVQAELEC